MRHFYKALQMLGYIRRLNYAFALTFLHLVYVVGSLRHEYSNFAGGSLPFYSAPACKIL